MIIRSKTFEQWMLANFDRDELNDIATHGADTGWGGLTYYRDTDKLYERFGDELWSVLDEIADSFGESDILDVLKHNTYAKNALTPTQFNCAIVWQVAEYYARKHTDR